MSRRVVIVVHEPAVGGATTAVLRVVPHLEREGWRFRFWASTPSPVADHLRERGHVVYGQSRPFRYSWSALAEPPGRWRRISAIPRYLGDFKRFIEQTAPDLVHANTIVTLPEALTARSTGVATLLHVHEMLPDGPQGLAAARLARLVDGVAAVSHSNAAALRRHGVAPRIVTAGIAMARASGAHQATPTRDGRPLVVGSLATISQRKGSDLFASAARAIMSARSDVEFRMVGPLGSGREAGWAHAVRARAQQSGVHCYATTDVFSEMHDWDLFVLPTRQDPFPLGILEAMASGVPVIASRVDGVPELVDVASGVLVAPDDPDALCVAVQELLDDPERRSAMGRAGASRVAQNFTLERHARELIDVYEATLDASRRRPRMMPW